MDLTCSSVQRNGERCTTAVAQPGATMCAHHERMMRLLAMAPKKTTPSVQPQSVAAAVPQIDESLTFGLPGEVKIASQQCVFEMYPGFQTKGIAGTLVITNYRLRFEPNQSISNQTPPMLYVAATRGMPIATVAKLLYPQSNNGAAAVPIQLLIQFRNLRMWCLRGNVQELMLLLNRHCFSISAASLFAFARGNGSVSDYEGHKLYDIAKDFAGMGVKLGQYFRLTELNRDFTLCPTYPALFGVPARMTDSQVVAVAEFRSKGRMPLLCWVHSSNSASLWRCAQPKRGIFHAQNSEDENMLLQIAQTNHINQLVWIVDCRPELNARANNLKGGGTESSSIRHATVTFMDIANIHAMRESIDNIRALLLSQNPDLDMMWNARVEETKWLFHIRRVLSTAIQTANAIHNTAQTVVVHCSDGWDRTAQVCALAQLLLDPRYRTLEGFFQLIEKEWIKAGHKFEDRISAGKAENDENSPVFLQFLDCVWQLTRQYPTHFQFNSAALMCIFEHAISGRFGTFVCNCERERYYLNVAGRTPSLWSFMLNHRHIYSNPFYREYDSTRHRGEQGALIPPISLVLRRVVLWDELYCDPNIPSCGNLCPPQYQESNTYQPAATAMEDLAKAYEAAKARIRDLEAQNIKQAMPMSAPMSAPTISYTPVPRHPPPAPAAIPHTSSLNNMGTLMSPLEATWKCRLCTKVNKINDLKCSVCGRLQ
ncbi:myotubularin-related protein 2 isoform X2, partial [Thraustotheca clavata]